MKPILKQLITAFREVLIQFGFFDDPEDRNPNSEIANFGHDPVTLR